MNTCEDGVVCPGQLKGKEKHADVYLVMMRVCGWEFVKKLHKSESEGHKRRGRPRGNWQDWVEHRGGRCINGRGMLEQERRKCWDRETRRLFRCRHALGNVSGESKPPEL